jgi:hypothetical protein
VATPTVVVLVVVAVGSVVTLVWLVLLLVRRVSAVADDVQELQRRVGPTLERLRQDVDVTNRELDRLGRSLDEAEGDEHDAAPQAFRAFDGSPGSG